MFAGFHGMRSGRRDKIGRVKVYRFGVYDIASEHLKVSARMTTPTCIPRIRAEIIKRTELEIDKRCVNSDGMREVGCYELPVRNGPVSGDMVCPGPTLMSS